MLVSGPIKSPKVIIKFLKDPSISPDIKEICIRLLRNPFLSQLFEKTPVSVIFEICNEYSKHPEIYDDIFSGKIKLFVKGQTEKALPVIEYDNMAGDENIQKFFKPNTLVGQVVEKFAVCPTEYKEIKRIAVKLKENKVMTAAFNSDNKIVSMLVDFLSKNHKENALANFLDSKKTQRVDLVKI